MSISGNIDHTGFQDRLSRSSPAVFAVAEHFHVEGGKVIIPPVLISPTRAENPQYTDDGDLWVIDGENNESRIEVKWRRTRQFTRSWKYPTMFVMGVDAWRKANEGPGEGPDMVLNVNPDCTYAAVVLSYTFEQWNETKMEDKQRGCIDLIYECPIELVDFIKLKKLKRE